MRPFFSLLFRVSFTAIPLFCHTISGWANDNVNDRIFLSKLPKNICLIYNGSSSRRQWTPEDFIPYLIYQEKGRKETFPLFDSFLLIEYRTSDGKYFWGAETNEQTAHANDWEWLANIWGSCLNSLNQSVQKLHQENFLKNKIGVIITLPEPNMKIHNFGSVPGKTISLDFKNENDRISAIRWYVDKVQDNFQSANYSYLELLGFYWLGESIPLEMESTVKQTALLFHQAGLYFFWIPYFTANNVWSWKNLGFDYMFYQPNYFFEGEGGTERLGLTAYRIEQFRCGAEIELDDRILTSKDHQLRFQQYLQTAVYFKWNQKPMAWYQSNDTIYKLAKEKNEKCKDLYRDIAHFIRGSYQPPTYLPPIFEYKIPSCEGFNLAHRNNGTKIIEPTSGFCSSLNPEWAIDGDVNFYSGTSGFACCGIPGEITIQFVKNFTISRVQMLLFNLDERYYQYRVEISEDKQHWETVIDKSQGKHRGWQTDTFSPRSARYLRIIPLFNSTGQHLFQLVELEVY